MPVHSHTSRIFRETQRIWFDVGCSVAPAHQASGLRRCCTAGARVPWISKAVSCLCKPSGSIQNWSELLRRSSHELSSVRPANCFLRCESRILRLANVMSVSSGTPEEGVDIDFSTGRQRLPMRSLLALETLIPSVCPSSKMHDFSNNFAKSMRRFRLFTESIWNVTTRIDKPRTVERVATKHGANA